MKVGSTFFERLSILLGSAVQLPRALEILGDSHPNYKVGARLFRMGETVKEGSSLHSAMEEYPHLFSRLEVRTVKAGEEAGNLPKALSLIADYLEKKEEFRRKLRTLATPPLVTFSFFILTAIVILVFVIPSFGSIYASIGREIPKQTKMVLAISKFIRTRWIALLASVASLWILIKILLRRTGFKKNLIDRITTYTPILRRNARRSASLTFTRSLSVLVGGGVQVTEAVRLAAESVDNRFMRAAAEDVALRTEFGMPIHRAMRECCKHIFSEEVMIMVEVGEEANKLGELLHQATKIIEQELESATKSLLALIQPLLTIVLGLMVAGLILSVYVPIFNLAYTLTP